LPDAPGRLTCDEREPAGVSSQEIRGGFHRGWNPGPPRFVAGLGNDRGLFGAGWDSPGDPAHFRRHRDLHGRGTHAPWQQVDRTRNDGGSVSADGPSASPPTGPADGPGRTPVTPSDQPAEDPVSPPDSVGPGENFPTVPASNIPSAASGGGNSPQANDRSALGVLLDAATLDAALRRAVMDRVPDNAFTPAAVLAVASSAGREALFLDDGNDLEPVGGPSALRLGTGTMLPAQAEAADKADGGPTPAPQVAGLVADALSLGLGALELAIQDFTDTRPSVSGSGAAVLYCLGLSSGVLGGILAYELTRRRATPPARIGLDAFGEPSLFPEEVS
jgi:hypothetical protein